MAQLTVHLLGQFYIGVDHQEWGGHLPGGKTQELFHYLLLHRHQCFPRETLAALLWPDCTTAKSKKKLRQSLWQLHAALVSLTRNQKSHIISIDAESIHVNTSVPLIVDVVIFERAYRQSQGINGEDLNPGQAKALQEAIELYRGDLLEGCYQEWCLIERERLQNCYLTMLDKVICYCRKEGDHQRALNYGERILRLDRAHERTHQQLMRVLYASGDRIGALRQYDRCKAALQEELGVEPSQRTQKLCEQIRSEAPTGEFAPPVASLTQSTPHAILHLQKLLEFINQVELQIRKELQAAQQDVQAPPRSAPSRQ